MERLFAEMGDELTDDTRAAWPSGGPSTAPNGVAVRGPTPPPTGSTSRPSAREFAFYHERFDITPDS